MSLVDLESRRLIAISVAAAELLGTTVEESLGKDCVEFAEQPTVAADALGLLANRTVDSMRAQRQFRQPDGPVVQLGSWIVAVRSGVGPDLALTIAETPTVAAVVEHSESVGPATSADRSPAVASLDEAWRVSRFSGDDWPVAVGSPLIDAVHPDSTAVLLMALGRATTQGSAIAQLRLRDCHNSWRAVAATIAVTAERPPRFSITLGTSESPREGQSDRVHALEDHLRRIVAEAEAAGVLGSHENDDMAGLAMIAELSPRQWEVALRLYRGESVPSIARTMYLSESTVRNHLSSIYQKTGVHSQAGLVGLMSAARLNEHRGVAPSQAGQSGVIDLRLTDPST